MKLGAGGSTQMFSLDFSLTSISLPLSHTNTWTTGESEEKRREEVGEGGEREREAREKC